MTVGKWKLNCSNFQQVCVCETSIVPISECLVVGKISSQISTHQRPILALVYPWYINTEHMEGKTK